MNTALKLALVTALIVCAHGPLAAQEPTPPPFQLHGYVTQGLGASDALPYAGVPTTGTTDMRAIAIQARYRLDDKSTVVTQISHRRIGESPMAPLEPAIELDWAFYRRAIGPVTVSVGRLPMARGFYNEIRDVGTLLPFFRAPQSIYPDGTEAVDGVAATTHLSLGSWAVEANVFAGGMEWKGVVSDGQQLYPYVGREEKNVGAQVWLLTPLTGVRAGISMGNYEDETAESGRNMWWVGSLEIDRDRWMLRSEVADLTAGGIDMLSGYAHGRFKITPKVHVMAQYEQTDMDMTVPVTFEWTEMKDAALGLAFAPSNHVVFKLEGHRAEGFGFDVPMDRTSAAGRSDYAILSMSVSF